MPVQSQRHLAVATDLLAVVALPGLRLGYGATLVEDPLASVVTAAFAGWAGCVVVGPMAWRRTDPADGDLALVALVVIAGCRCAKKNLQ